MGKFEIIRRLFLVAVFVVCTDVNAEKYFTWVDEQGRVHNQLIPDDESSEDASKTDASDAPKVKSKANFFTWVDERGIIHNDPLPESNKPESFIDSEQLEKQNFNRIKDERPFFVWTDAAGIVRQTFYPNNVSVNPGASAATDLGPRFTGVPFTLEKCCQFLTNTKQLKLVLKEDKLVKFTTISRHLPFTSGRSPYALLKLSAGKQVIVKSFIGGSSIFNPVAVFLDAEFSLISGRQFWLSDFVASSGFYKGHYRGAVELPKGAAYMLLLTTDDLLGSSSMASNQLVKHGLQGELSVKLED